MYICRSSEGTVCMMVIITTLIKQTVILDGIVLASESVVLE